MYITTSGNYTEWDYIIVLLMGSSIIGLAWDKMNIIIAALSIIVLIPIVLVSWIFSHGTRSAVEWGEEKKYLVNEKRENVRFLQESQPGDMSTFTIYKQIIGPMYIKEKSYRDSTGNLPSSIKETEEILNKD